MSITEKFSNWRQPRPVVRYSPDAPSAQNIADIFKGEWLSRLPGGLETEPGSADLFNDARIQWLNSLGWLRDKTILELGPLEAGHTFMMHAMGAKRITAVEANERAFLKCLCVKELFGLDRAAFRFGDLMRYLETAADEQFDLVVASGVLYHMTEPLKLLSLLCARADRIFIWTHYFDAGLLDGKLGARFSELRPIAFEGKTYYGARRFYSVSSLRRKSFSGGSSNQSVWLDRDSILQYMGDQGFECSVQFDDRGHPHGPSFAVSAIHPRAFQPHLPDDFDPMVYLRLHEDVAAAGMDPRLHYLEYGEVEGRAYRD
jgi:hypothetical protein